MANYVIIGNGVAGVRAVEAIRDKDKKGKITMVSAESYPFYYRPQLADYIAGRVGEEGMWGRLGRLDFYKEKKIDLQLGRRVAQVVPDSNQIVFEDGGKLGYDRLLIASGASAVGLVGIPGADLGGVVSLWSLADAKKIVEQAKSAEQAVVIGERPYGLELVRAFREMGLKVTFLISGDHLWPELLDVSAAKISEEWLVGKGVEVRKGEKVIEVLGSDGGVGYVRTDKEDKIACEIVGVGGGVKPNIEFLTGSGIRVDEGVLVDEHLRTNVTNIYAAGDVAQAYDMVYESPRLNRGWLNAWYQGEVAGANMAGESKGFVGLASTHVQIYGLDLLALGKANAKEEGYRVMVGDFAEMGVYKKLVLKAGKIVGALFLGNVSEGGTVESLIKRGADISQLDEKARHQMFDVLYWRPSVLGVYCPVCKLEIKLPAEAREGDVLTCPICGVDLRLERLASGFLAGMPVY